MRLDLYVEGEQLPLQFYFQKYFRVYRLPVDIGLRDCNEEVVNSGIYYIF
jgi:hypothetical protein